LSRWNVWPQHGLVCTLDCTRSSWLTCQAWVKLQWPVFRRKAPPYSMTRTLGGLKCVPVELSWKIGSLLCIPNILGCLQTVTPTLLTVVHTLNVSTTRRRVEFSWVELSLVELCRYKHPWRDRQTDKHGQKHVPPLLSEVINDINRSPRDSRVT